MRPQKTAFSDFDGTLSKGYASMDFMEHLHKRGSYSDDSYKKQMLLFEEHRNGKVSYDEWVQEWAKLLAEGLAGREERDVADEAARFYESSFRHNVYESSYDAIKELKKRGFRLVLVSVGMHEMISAASRDLGMDDVIATRCEVANGRYTGRLATRLHHAGGKADALERYMKKHACSRENSAAMGDSEQDVAMLELVGHPIVVNPSKKLEKLAKENGWPVCNYGDIVEFVRKL